MKTAVFVERDAVLNHVRVCGKTQMSPTSLEEFRPHTDAIEHLLSLKRLGHLLIATTNQPGLSQGLLSRRELDRMHDILRHQFQLDDIFICPHTETDHCPCRKPKPGLLIEAAFKWHIDLDHSFVVSDKWQDAEAARTAGCTSLLLSSPWVGPVHHDFIMSDISQIVRKIHDLSRPKILPKTKPASPHISYSR